MHVVVTVASISKESAGPSYTVPALCEGLAKNGAEVELHVLDDVPDIQRAYRVQTYRRCRLPVYALGRSPELLNGLREALKDSDIVHNNGIWMMPNVYPAIAKRGTNCKLVFCPRGGLSQAALKRSRVKKFLMGHLGGQYMALRETDMFHAASMKELHEIRELGYEQPIALVPNGIDIPCVRHKPFEAVNRKLAFFGRIHETKAVDQLVEAWGNVADKFRDWSLEIAGPDCGALAKIQRLIASRRIPRVAFTGELHGAAKYEFLSSVDLYALPSLTENFGITIAEALACGTPVVASKGCPWERLNEKKCGWWVDIGVDALTAQLEESLSLSPAMLKSMGMAGKIWMQSEYSWDTVAKEMMQAYKWLCAGGIKPEFVY